MSGKLLTNAAVLVFGLSAFAASALAQERGDRRIAAIVNRDAITQYDLEQRIRLAGLGARLPETGEARQRLVNDVLRSMINERLQVQEAVRQRGRRKRREAENQHCRIGEELA